MNLVDKGKKSLVWAKLKYCPYWPARLVFNPPPDIGKTPPGNVCVFFFGSKNYGFVPAGNIADYVANRVKYEKKGQSRGRTFKEAVAQMDEFVLDPITFSPNGHAEPNNNEIVVKTERCAVVKTEKEIDEIPYEIEVIQTANTTAQYEVLKKEKENIIKDLIATKGENQKMFLQLQQKQRELDNLKRSTLLRTESLESELKDLNIKFEAEQLKQKDNAKKISDLLREKNLLSAQVIDMRSATQQSQPQLLMENADDTDYEVDRIQNHRIFKRERQFLISWKGFSSEHDQWVKEKHLNCPLILKTYLESNGLSLQKRLLKSQNR